MGSALRPSPQTAALYLERLKDFRFAVNHTKASTVHPLFGELVQEDWSLEDEETALQQVRTALDWEEVELMIEGWYRPPGQYPFNRFTLVISTEGVPVMGFFGE